MQNIIDCDGICEIAEECIKFDHTHSSCPRLHTDTNIGLANYYWRQETRSWLRTGWNYWNSGMSALDRRNTGLKRTARRPVEHRLRCQRSC